MSNDEAEMSTARTDSADQPILKCTSGPRAGPARRIKLGAGPAERYAPSLASIRSRGRDMARIKRARWLAAASAAIVGWASSNARANDGFWGAFSSGDFTDSSKWFVGVLPTSDG